MSSSPLHRVVITLLLATGVASSAVPYSTDTSAPHPARVSTVYHFPSGTFLENIDQRRSGEILTTELTKPHLWQLDPRQPSTQKPALVTTIFEKTGLVGISEIAQDVFAVIGGNFTDSVPLPSPLSGSFSIYKVDLNRTAAGVSKIVDVPDALLLNGLTFVPGNVVESYPEGFLLGSDSFRGLVYSVDLANAHAKVWLKDPLMAACPPAAGINGILYNDFDETVYFANSGCQNGFLAFVPLDMQTGEPIGTANIVGGTPQGIHPDDFDIDQHMEKAYVAASSDNQADEVDLLTGKTQVVAGSPNSPLIARGTSVRLGRTVNDVQRGVFYMSTAGTKDDQQIGGQILAIRK